MYQEVNGLCECCLAPNVVLWNTKHCPAGIVKLPCDPKITLSVCVYLVHPKAGVQSRVFAALRATVPEATVNEDNDPFSREDQVGIAKETLASYGLVAFMSNVPNSSTPQSRSQSSLRPGSAPVVCHSTVALGSRHHIRTQPLASPCRQFRELTLHFSDHLQKVLVPSTG